MKRAWKLWAALAGLALLAGVTWGDNNVLNHGTYYSNAATQLKTDASGNLYTTESQPPMDASMVFANVINNTALAVAAADSNAAPLDTRRMRLGMLLIKVWPAIGSAQRINHIALQIRTHLYGGTDSLSTFVINPYGQGQGGISATLPDTTQMGHLLLPTASVVGSGEIDIATDGARVGPNGSASTIFFWPSGIAIPIQSLYGRDVYSQYTTIRVRNLSGPTCAITVHLIGTPL